MASNQGKYKPSVSAIDEVDDHIVKHGDIDKQQIEGSETAPLTTNQHKLHIHNTMTNKDMDTQNEHETDAANSTRHASMNGLRGRLSMDALMRLSRKRRFLYITTACLCAVLLVIIIFMIAFWPEVPFYLKSKLCLEKECMEASKQLLLWANTSKDPCHQTYDWACGNFAQEYAEHDYFVIKTGEWNYKTYREYHELNELNRFISMLPFTGVSYSVESMITTLFRSCREIDALDKSQSDMLLKKAINSLDGWQAFRDSNLLQFWEYKKALIQLHVTYGIFPYYKITVENRFNKPHDYIIAIDEGEIGLPAKYFYNVEPQDEVVRGYKLLLRDFAINMGMVSREAGFFADEVFHYEQRIVNDIGRSKSSGKQNLNQIKTLAEVKTIAPSLPIIKTIQAMFPHIKITEETEVLVRNADALSQISTVVSTTDKKPLNNYIIWSLVSHLLPHLSKEYRNLIQNFDDAVYGRTAAYPRWMICSQIVKEWLPFAVDALQQTEEHKLKWTSYPNKTQANDEVLRLMFHTLRNQLQLSVNEAKGILPEVKTYIKEKLTTMRLQIGIPSEVLKNGSYIKDYYNQLVLNNLYFVEHLESIWSFRKTLMEEKLQALGIVDTIISEMYAHEKPKILAYSKILNMLIISPNMILKTYYDYRFPIAINFARMGNDILEILIDAISLFVKQFKADEEIVTNDFDLPKVRIDCIVAQESQRRELYELPSDTLNKFQVTLSAAKITVRALSSFIENIDSNKQIMGAASDQALNYEELQLNNRLRIPGLRSFNEYEVFVLAYMQKHCSTPIADKDYMRIKPHVEQILAERYLFNATWNHIKFFHRAVSCFVPDVRCANLL